MNVIVALIFYALGLLIAYFVIRLAVCHGINDSNLFNIRTTVGMRDNISEAINNSNVKKCGDPH